MSEAAVTAPGWFGKLPALGDFASRRLPAAFVRGLDGWLQQGLAAAIDSRGAEWLDAYVSAPPRRFWLAAGLLDRRAFGGVLLPSVDCVGRRFAFALATPAQGPEADSGWGSALEAIARRIFDEGYGVEALERDLAGLAPRSGDGKRPPPFNGSLWWRGDRAEGRLAFEALPPPASFATLFAADGLR